jgi:small subunit ribosomal protein S2
MSTSSTNTLIERLFGAGAHFGFKKSRRHPTVTPYLFTAKDGNDIFDLEQSAASIAAAAAVLEEAGKNGKVVLFVGTKDEVARVVQDTATKVAMPYVVNRWIGGMLTNFSEMKKRIYRLESLIAEKESGELDRKYTKKERVLINREVDKLQHNFGGIKQCTKIADLMVVVDPRHDSIAVTEAREMRIPVVAIMSSDCDISLVNYPIVVNDALQSSVALVLGELATAYAAGAATYVPRPAPTRPMSTGSTDSRPRRPRTGA